MKDLLGIDVSEDKYFKNQKSDKPKQTLKAKFRRSYGYKDGYYCKNCSYFGYYEQSRRWYKCDMLGRSSDKRGPKCCLYSASNCNFVNVAC